MIQSLDDIWDSERDRWLPRREALPILPFAATITLPGGTRKGTPYNPASHAGQLEFFRAYEAPSWRELVLVGPTQDGKTVCGILVPLLHRLFERREDAVYGLPDELLAQKQWREKIIPVMRLSGMSNRMPLHGGGSREGGRVTIQQFADGGLLTWIGGGSKNESAQSSVSAPLVLADEVDSMKAGILEKIQRRADSYDNLIGWTTFHARRIYTSTIKRDDGTSKILGLLAQSTDARLHFKCPSCGRFQALSWERVTYDPTDDLTAFDTARMACEHCAVAWTDNDRKLALRTHRLVMRGQVVNEAGDIVGDAPRSMVWGLLWTALDSPLRHLGQLCVWHRRALEAREKGDHEPARQFWRDQLCQPYLSELEEMETGTELTWQSLLARSVQAKWGVAVHSTDRSAELPGYTYSRHAAEPPPEAAFCCGGVDVQQNRIYAELSAYSMDGTSYDIAWGYQYARTDQMPWNVTEIAELLTVTGAWMRECTKALPLVTIGLDVGDSTDALMAFLKTQRGGLWRATKGASTSLKDEPGDIPGVLHYRNGVCMLQTDTLRAMIHSGYRRPSGLPGSINLPSGLKNTSTGTAYLRHLVAEMEIMDPKTKKTKVRHGPGRWDWHDARRITHAMALWYLRREQMRANQPARNYGIIKTL